MNIMVIDGQGGGIGKAIVEKLKKELPPGIKITALGTNSAATQSMLKAGADEGATGENAVMVNVKRADVITGPTGIILANSMLGEMTPKMAGAIAGSSAKKVLIPVNLCNLYIAGVADESIPERIDKAVKIVKSFCEEE